MVPLIKVLMITNQGYWLPMVNNELSDRLKLIKYQIKIFQKMTMVYLIKTLGSQVHSNQRTKISNSK